jgi:hypothetical protein
VLDPGERRDRTLHDLGKLHVQAGDVPRDVAQAHAAVCSNTMVELWIVQRRDRAHQSTGSAAVDARESFVPVVGQRVEVDGVHLVVAVTAHRRASVSTCTRESWHARRAVCRVEGRRFDSGRVHCLNRPPSVHFTPGPPARYPAPGSQLGANVFGWQGSGGVLDGVGCRFEHRVGDRLARPPLGAM